MNVTQFLASVKRRAYVPENGAELSDAEILSIGDEAFVETIAPAYSRVREGFLQQDASYPCNTDRYTAPPRSLGGGVLSVRFVDPSGIMFPIAHIDDSQRQWSAQLTAPMSPATVWRWEGEQVVLQPAPPSGQQGTIVMTYVAAPSSLTNDSTNYLLVGGVDYTTRTITVASNPVLFSVLQVDVVAQDGSHNWRQFGSTVTAVHTTFPYTLTLDVLPATAGVKAGDIVALAGYTIWPQCPDSLHPIFALETARRYLDAIVDPRAEALAAEFAEKFPKALSLIAPRAGDQPKRAINRRSALRTLRSRGYWWGWGPMGM